MKLVYVEIIKESYCALDVLRYKRRMCAVLYKIEDNPTALNSIVDATAGRWRPL